MPKKGQHHSEESKNKNSISHLGKIPWNKGLKGVMKAWNKGLKGVQICSNETKKKMSNKQKGENHHLYGKHQSEETKQKISKAHIGKSCPQMCGDKNPSKRLEVRKKNSESQSGEKGNNWQGGKSFEPYCEKFNERKREEIREQYGRKCYICGLNEKENITKTGKQWRLSVHHTDFDKEQGCNGKQWKLVPLCLHHHNSKKMNNT